MGWWYFPIPGLIVYSESSKELLRDVDIERCGKVVLGGVGGGNARAVWKC